MAEWRDVDIDAIPAEQWAWLQSKLPPASTRNLRRLIWWAMWRQNWVLSVVEKWTIELARWDEAEQARVVIRIGIDSIGRPIGAQRFVERPTHEASAMDEIAGLL